MKYILRIVVTFVLITSGLSDSVIGQQQQRRTVRRSRTTSVVRETNVRAHMEFLASDALQGRGSGTQYELIAGQYIASQLRQFGIAPAGDNDPTLQVRSYIQAVKITNRTFTEAPTLDFNTNGTPTRLTHGLEMLIGRINAPRINGPLQKIDASGKPRRGAMVFMTAGDAQQISRRLPDIIKEGAAAVMIEETPRWRQNWSSAVAPSYREIDDVKSTAFNLIVLSTAAANAMRQVADDTQMQVAGRLSEPDQQQTRNVIGELRGTDPRLSREAVIISAHMDHLGVRGDAPGDHIYNGADDDASGVVAVLEMARALGAGLRPRRTVYFVLFGSEENGGYGAQYFLDHPPTPVESMVANLEFEMIGRPDPKVAAETLWLTGYERSNLGSTLAARGARLVADPHPDQNFFQRSDNYALAKRGVVAHTVSSFSLHPEYHQPNDDIAHINFAHMTRAINSMIEPVRWLVNSAFRPAWVEGQRP